MAIFNNMRITDKGKVLYAKAQAGKELHFTKMKVGAGNVESRNPDTLLDLIDGKYDVGIQSISPNPETKSAVISGMINNGAVTEPTYICEIGLYAEDPDEGEILYGYASAGQYGDYYAPNTVGAFTWNYQINAAIGNAANVTVELSNLVYDYGVINTNSSFIHLSGGNQKEINKSIDNMFKEIKESNDHIYYCEASGTLNNYRVSIPEYTKNKYTKGMGIAVLINANSTDASTINVNELGTIPIKKSNGKDFTNFKANSIYTMRYNGTNFILQGEGANGNAKSSDLLLGKTAESDEGELVGTIPLKKAQTYVPGTVDQIIEAGQYLKESQIIKGEPNLIAPNIVKGKKLFDIDGEATIESLGGISEKDILSGKIKIKFRYKKVLEKEIKLDKDYQLATLGRFDNENYIYINYANKNNGAYSGCVLNSKDLSIIYNRAYSDGDFDHFGKSIELGDICEKVPIPGDYSTNNNFKFYNNSLLKTKYGYICLKQYYEEHEHYTETTGGRLLLYLSSDMNCAPISFGEQVVASDNVYNMQFAIFSDGSIFIIEQKWVYKYDSSVGFDTNPKISKFEPIIEIEK